MPRKADENCDHLLVLFENQSLQRVQKNVTSHEPRVYAVSVGCGVPVVVTTSCPPPPAPAAPRAMTR